MNRILGTGLIIFSLPFFLDTFNNLMFLMNAEEGSIVTDAIPHAIISGVIGFIPLFFGIKLLRKYRSETNDNNIKV